MGEKVITAKDVLDFFKNANPELAGLVHDLAGERIQAARELRETRSASLKKARAARGSKKAAAAAAATAGADAAAPVTAVAAPSA